MPERPKIELGAYKKPESTDDDLIELKEEDLELIEEGEGIKKTPGIVDNRLLRQDEAEDTIQRFHAWRSEREREKAEEARKAAEEAKKAEEARRAEEERQAKETKVKIAVESRSALSGDSGERIDVDRLKTREAIVAKERFELEEKKIDLLIQGGADPEELKEIYAMTLSEAEEGLAELLQEIQQMKAQDTTDEKRIAQNEHRSGERRDLEAIIITNRHRLEYLERRQQEQDAA